MGLDLVVQSCAKPGCEAEWRRLIERSFADEALTDADVARFEEISIPPYERLGAPRVGYDKSADAWILQTRKAVTQDEIAAVLEEFHGYYALALVESDGVPAYSHGGLYDGVDETSFRGAFLSECADVLAKGLIHRAWEDRLPEAAIDYGRALLEAADAAAAAGPPARSPPKRGVLAGLFGAKRLREALAFEEQLKIVRSAGRWFVFWGERGHAIRAWV